MAGPQRQRDHGVGFRGGVGDALIIDRLHVAAIGQLNRLFLALSRRRRRRFFIILFRQQAGNVAVQLATHVVDNVICDNRAGEVMHEQQQGNDADQHQQRAAGHGQIGDVVAIAIGAAQHQQQIDHGADEQAERRLRAPVAHEVADQPRAELLRGQRQHHHGDRDGQRRHRDHRGHETGQELRRLASAAAEQEPDLLSAKIETDCERGISERRGRDDHGERQRPQA